jgi:hypothetical protein
LLSFAAQFTSKIRRSKLDDAVVGCAQKNSLLDLFLDHQFCQAYQKFLLFLATGLLGGVDAWFLAT